MSLVGNCFASDPSPHIYIFGFHSIPRGIKKWNDPFNNFMVGCCSFLFSFSFYPLTLYFFSPDRYGKSHFYLNHYIVLYLQVPLQMDVPWLCGFLLCTLSVLTVCSGAPWYWEQEEIQEIKRAEKDLPDTLGPPVRPAKFKNKAELQLYLDSLREYYSVIGRPRYVQNREGFIYQSI